MPYGGGKFPPSYKNLDAPLRDKAVSILNAMLREGKMDEGMAIPAALAKARESMKEMRVLEFSNAIRGVELFAPGEHNGDPYTEQDIDDIVAAAAQLDYRPAIKVGHTKGDKPGAPAYGYVENLRKQGGKLVADLTDMHDSVVDAIRKRSYDRLSSEIYMDLKRAAKDGTQKVFRRALKAVALLGVEVPAVANLVPLHKMEFVADGEYKAIGAMEQKLDVNSNAIAETLIERLAQLVKEHAMGPMMTRGEMLSKMKKEYPDASDDELKGMVDKAMQKQANHKERDMEITELNGQIKKLNEELAALQAVDGKDGAAKIKALSERLAALSAEAEKIGSGDAELKAQLKSEQEARKADQARIAQLEQESRERTATAKAEALKVPAIRPAVKALYKFALEHPAEKLAVFSTNDKGQEVREDRTIGELMDKLVADLNGPVGKLFAQMATQDKRRMPEATEDKAADELVKRTKAYQHEHPDVKKYSEAEAKVLEADPDLARRYNEELAEKAGAPVRHS